MSKNTEYKLMEERVTSYLVGRTKPKSKSTEIVARFNEKAMAEEYMELLRKQQEES